MNKYQEMDFNLSQWIQFHTVSSWYQGSKLLYLTIDACVHCWVCPFNNVLWVNRLEELPLSSLARILFLVRSDSGLIFYRSKNVEQKGLGFNGKQRGMQWILRWSSKYKALESNSIKSIFVFPNLNSLRIYLCKPGLKSMTKSIDS